MAITGFFIWLCIDMWKFYKVHHETLDLASAGSFGALALAAIKAVQFCFESWDKKIETDD